MIEITPEIMGPGIEEEYADALAAINEIRLALGPRRLTNDTPDGRLLLNVQWVEQEIKARRLPVPPDPSYVGTILYLVGSQELGSVEGLNAPLSRLYLVLKGTGLMKPRHLPVLIAMMDDLLADMARCPSVTAPERSLINEMTSFADDLRRGGDWPKLRRPQEYFSTPVSPNLEACVDNFANRTRMIDFPLFDCWRPHLAQKPPLAAPVLGLPAKAPPLPPELEGRLP